MDYPSEDGENFFSPNPPEDQKRQIEHSKQVTIAASPIIEELVADFEKELAAAKSIDGIQIGNGIHTDAQILAKGEIAAFCEKKLAHYRELYKSTLPEEEDKS